MMIFMAIASLFILDVLTKTIFTNQQFFEGSWIFIRYTENFGSSFGLFASIPYYTQIIFTLSFIALAILLATFRRFTGNKSNLLAYFFIFLTSGLLGNTFDRVIFGFVRDFIGLKGLFIFNFADLYITIAAILIIIYEFKKK